VYAMRTGSCKYFLLKDVRRKAIRKFGGSAQALVGKSEALNKRRQNKAEKDQKKRQDEAKRRANAAAEAERQGLEAIEEKKRTRLEKKRQAEDQARDANSWRALVTAMDGTGLELNGSTLTSILEDIQEWKKRKLVHQEYSKDCTIGPISPPKETIDGTSASAAKVSPS
jgi:hypothetical protein